MLTASTRIPTPLAIRATALIALATIPYGRLSAQIGFSPPSAAVQATLEQRLLALADTANARLMTRDLSARPHMAGTHAQADTRDYVIGKLQSWGLETWVKEYSVYLPQPEIVAAWVYQKRGVPAERLKLAEPPVAGDPTSLGPQVPTFNAYSADGDVTAPVVNVNYGLEKDYRMLDSLGVSVRGRIAIARYGYSFRGIKAREAERRGAIGLILYSDPQDDGYFHGDIYPRGPMRPPGGIQRGQHPEPERGSDDARATRRSPARPASRWSRSRCRGSRWCRSATGTPNGSSPDWEDRPPRKDGRAACRCTITSARGRRVPAFG